MHARFKGGPADGLDLSIRGDRDPRPGAPRRILAVIAVFECVDQETWLIPVEFPNYPDQQLLEFGDGLWTDYISMDIVTILDWPFDQQIDLVASFDG